MRDLARLMLEIQGLRKPLIHVPVPLCRAAAWVMEHTMSRPPLTRYAISRILHDTAPDCGEARRDLGYDPVGVKEGLRRCFGVPPPATAPR
jgi:NADH dehydrogenase